jgi:hypothetical protein
MRSRRQVVHADALPWLRERGRLTGASFITSLPDLSELPGLRLPGWREWFQQAATRVMDCLHDAGLAMFFQSDVRKQGEWVDNAALLMSAAAAAGVRPLFHKVVCRLPPGTVTSGRDSYANLCGFARAPRRLRHSCPDVLADGGFRVGEKAMGVLACLEACRFVMRDTPSRVVVDPFCGWGTVLAVANTLGLDAIGIDRSARMCRHARKLHAALPPEP